MTCDVKLQHDQMGGIFSCVEVNMPPFQFGPPPHVHYDLDEIMYVLESTITVPEDDKTREVQAHMA